MAVELSTVSYWECVVALILGAVIWAESLTVIGAIGGVLIIVGGMAPIPFDLMSRKQAPAEVIPER